MDYNFQKYNIPVKVIDHTETSFTFGEIKNLASQLGEKHQSKKK